MLSFVRVVHGLSRLAGLLSALMILASVVLVCQLVTVRYVLNASTVWQTETVIYLMIGATLIGMPYVQLLRGHINVDLVPLYLPPRARRWLFLGCVALQALACVVLGYYALELFLEALHGNWRSASVWGPPLWIPYLALPLGFGLLVLQYAADALMAFRVEDPFTTAGDPEQQPMHAAGRR